MALVRHFAALTPGLVVLWLFLIWYATMVVMHFEAAPRLWLNAAGMALLVGTALLLSVGHTRTAADNFWRVFRLYAIPFCVSSFSALVRDDGFYTIFAPGLGDNLIALTACAMFVFAVRLARRQIRKVGRVDPPTSIR